MLRPHGMAIYVPPPLEAAWEPLLVRVAPRRVETVALALMVSRLSRRYLGEEIDLARGDELVARVRFFFPRDLHKSGLPIAELLLAGALPTRPLRVLDLGAGVGATSAGMLRTLANGALRAERATVRELHLVDRDAEMLGRARALLDDAARSGLLVAAETLETRVGDLSAPTSIAGTEPYDLVLLGNALVEATRDAGDELARGEAIATLLAAIAESAPLASDGSLVVIEPATRADTRALHRARAILIERGFGIFAPCTHQDACPMLTRERDWCHEDLPVDLPAWLVPVAREAGLRWEGLTFSYLVVRRDRRSVGEVVGRDAGAWVRARVVSSPRESKGKTEAFASGAFADGVTGPRLMQLDREVKRATGAGVVLADLARGDLIAVEPSVAHAASGDRPLRVAPTALVRATADRNR